MSHFDQFNLPAPLAQALAKMNFDTPTPIQEAALPFALDGRDILGSAQTGTGKTGAFGIPLVARLLSNPRGSALVLLPTRELAQQVMDTLQKFLSKSLSIQTALLIGGESMPKQFEQLRRRPRVIVGTPGRIIDHLERGSLMLHEANYLVLDETDRMLDMGFGIQLDKILKYLPATRQTLMFSATLPKEIIKMSEKYLKSPERIAMGSTTATAERVTQEIIHTTEAEKYTKLVDQLNARTGSIIVFTKTKWGAERLAQKLDRAGHSADAIHGDLQQRQRDRAIQAFRDKRFRILVATDIASRGLDIPHIEHVINLDLPQCPEDYIHRIGRTARAGAEGAAVAFVTPEDGVKWKAILKLIDPEAYAALPRNAPKKDGAHKQRRRRMGGEGRSGGENRGGGERRNGGGGERREGGNRPPRSNAA